MARNRFDEDELDDRKIDVHSTVEFSKSTIYHKDSWVHGFKVGFKRWPN